ncbi:MAG: hutC [Collimonas fungivorans]|uniref:histidine utilization repressor n=1 Tax=Collimonas fungivorans TaxID=158899 RepID=UPI0026E99070|nr:histidine utilization repressor [Collimonas fungivorans]MDB5766274.1 hutC [Collimonas fungivorans]
MHGATNNKAVPAFQQVKDHVLQQIRSGDWKPGDLIPSERELMLQFSLSRMTVNRALRELTDNQLLVRIQGSGTYVAPGKYQSTLVEIHSIDDELVARGHRYRSQVLTLEASNAPVALKALELESGPAFHSVIVHFADDIPIQLEDRYTNPQLFPDYLQQDFHRITPNHYMVQIAPLDKAEYSIESKMPDAAVRKLLQMEAGEPCLLLSRRTWVRQAVATSVTLWHPGSRYQFTGGF